MDDTYHAGLPAGFDAHTAASDSSGSRNTPKEGNDDIPYPLGDQFLVSLQADARHVAGYRTAQQAFHRTQRSNGQSRADKFLKLSPGYGLPTQPVSQQQCLGDLPDHGYRPVDQRIQHGGANDPHQG